VGIDSPFPPLARVTEHRHVQDETPPDTPPEGRSRRDFLKLRSSPQGHQPTQNASTAAKSFRLNSGA
jgi:hypothetical protein